MPRPTIPAAAQAIGEADLIYLSGGKPAYLMRVLDGSAVGQALADAHQRGAVLAGCSAGAMVLARHAFDFRVRIAPWPLRWRFGLGFVDAASVIPHYDAWPEPLSALIALQAPRGSRGARDRRGDRGRRPRRRVAGPRPVAGHGLARSPARPLSGRGDVPDLTSLRQRGQSGRTVRKQSEQ